MSQAVASPSTRPQGEPAGWVLPAMLVVSVVLHGVGLVLVKAQQSWLPKNEPITVEIVQVEPPKPPPPPPPEPEKPPEPPKPKIKPPPVKIAETPKPPPPEDAPPPPIEESKEPPKPVPVVVGISMSSTTAAGAFAAPVGNTAYGKVADKAVDPSTVKPYSAPRYVPPGSADRDPELLADCKTEYPDEAKRADVEGTVRLRVTVDVEGKVVDVKLVSGPGYGLDDAARRAITRCRFKPAIKNGEAVSTSFTYNYIFQLD